MYNVEQMHDLLLEMGVNAEVIDVVTSINGYNTKSMEDILYSKFGYRSFDHLFED